MSGLIGKQLSKAKSLLMAGELVAIPTETVYGLAANAFNQKAVAKIFAIKNRPTFNPLIVHVADVETIYKIAESVPELAIKLINTFCPGPLTILLNKKPIIKDLITAGFDTVALRIPKHPLTLELLQTLSFPLVAPSANTFQALSPTSTKHVFEDMGNKIPYILEGGSCEIGIESTIIGFENNQPIIYRQGAIDIEEIKKIVPQVSLKQNPNNIKKNRQTPGMLKKHYCPKVPLFLGVIPDLLLKYQNKKIGLLSFKTKYLVGQNVSQLILSEKGDYLEAGKHFFDMLHQLQNSDIELIIAELLPEISMGKAINDRLKRGAKIQ